MLSEFQVLYQVLSHLESCFFYRMEKRSNFILLHLHILSSQNHLLKEVLQDAREIAQKWRTLAAPAENLGWDPGTDMAHLKLEAHTQYTNTHDWIIDAQKLKKNPNLFSRNSLKDTVLSQMCILSIFAKKNCVMEQTFCMLSICVALLCLTRG